MRGEAEPAGVVDRREDVLPAGATRRGRERSPVTRWPGSDDTPQFLDVDVDELAGTLALVADDLLRGCSASAASARGGAGSRARSRPPARAPSRAGAGRGAVPPAPAGPPVQRSPASASASDAAATGAISETLAAPRPRPTHFEAVCREQPTTQRRRRDRHPISDQRNQALALPTAESSISMKNPSSPPCGCDSDKPHPRRAL